MFDDNLDRTATGNDLRKLAVNVDSRFDAVDRRFDAVDRRFDAVDRRFDAVDREFLTIRKEMASAFSVMNVRFDAMNERFNNIEHRLTHHFVNSIGWMIATNIAVFGTVIASLAYLADYLR